MEEKEGYVRVLVQPGDFGLSFDEAAVVTAVEKGGATFLKVAVGWRLIGVETRDNGMVHAKRGTVTTKVDADKLKEFINSQAGNERELMFKRPLDEPLVVKDGCVSVVAPPGPLGLHMVSGTAQGGGGAVVDRVERGSPIAPFVRSGMTILTIDGDDVSCLPRQEVAAMLVKRAERPERVMTLALPYESPWPMRILVAIGLFAVLFLAFIAGGIILSKKLEERKEALQAEAEFVVGKLVEQHDFSQDFLAKVAMPAMMKG